MFAKRTGKFAAISAVLAALLMSGLASCSSSPPEPTEDQILASQEAARVAQEEDEARSKAEKKRLQEDAEMAAATEALHQESIDQFGVAGAVLHLRNFLVQTNYLAMNQTRRDDDFLIGYPSRLECIGDPIVHTKYDGTDMQRCTEGIKLYTDVLRYPEQKPDNYLKHEGSNYYALGKVEAIVTMQVTTEKINELVNSLGSTTDSAAADIFEALTEDLHQYLATHLDNLGELTHESTGKTPGYGFPITVVKPDRFK